MNVSVNVTTAMLIHFCVLCIVFILILINRIKVILKNEK